MAKVPYISDPHQQWEREHSSTINSTAKSRFKFLFHWHKNSHAGERPFTRNGFESVPQSSANDGRPPLSPRSFSENMATAKPLRLHSSDGPRSRTREKILTDPPPLIQAYRQASIQAALETPVSFTETVRSRHDILTAKELQSQEVLEDAVQVKCAHKKTDSGQDICITKPQTFMLVHGPYLLQFPGDAEPNTLPEKILLLDKDCVAFACDTVPGRPWVLQISKTTSVIQGTQEKSLRPSWSRLTLRQPEDKRTVNTMLIVFDDSEELYTWLFAIRKEIEHLGGAEYRPVTEQDDRTWRENLTRRFGSTPDETTDLQLFSPEPQRTQNRTLAKDSRVTHPATTTARPQSQESSTSSNQTSTSLERLRDSLTSNTFPKNLARVSATDSASSASPVTDCFPNIGSVTDITRKDLSLRAYSRTSNSRSGRSQSQPARNSILERRNLSVGSLTLGQPEAPKPWKVLPNLPPTISGSPNDDLSHEQKPPALSSANISDVASTSTEAKSHNLMLGEKQIEVGKEQHENARSLTRSASQADGAFAKPKYTLFPVRSVPEAKDEPLASPNSLAQTASPPKSRSTSRVASRLSNQEPKSFGKHRKSRSRTVTLELRQHRKSALLGLGQFDVPLRSPAVTDDMITSNFGVNTQTIPLSPMPVSQVPGLADLTFNLDFLKFPYQQPVRRPMQGTQRTPSTRSISSSHSDASAGFTKAPLGPPPAGPLPAVPQRSSQASHISQHSQRSNASHYSSKRSTGLSSRSPVPQVSLSRSGVHTLETHSGENPSLHKHSRTVSSALNVSESIEPSPPAYTSKNSFEQAQTRSRSRTRGRQISLGQHN